MILLLAVLIGLLAGMARAGIGKRSLRTPAVRMLWLVLIAYLPQAIVFSLPTRAQFSQETAAVILVLTQALLLVFALVNWRQAGFVLMALGLALNLLVISLNGGLMPISPETISRRNPSAPAHAYTLEERLAGGKDIVLLPEDTRLEILSDRFVTPSWFPYHVAYSMGDIILSAGVILFLWSLGGPPTINSPS